MLQGIDHLLPHTCYIRVCARLTYATPLCCSHDHTPAAPLARPSFAEAALPSAPVVSLAACVVAAHGT